MNLVANGAFSFVRVNWAILRVRQKTAILLVTVLGATVQNVTWNLWALALIYKYLNLLHLISRVICTCSCRRETWSIRSNNTEGGQSVQ